MQPCTVGNSSVIMCTIPVLDLPDEFQNLSDPSVTFPYNDEGVRFVSVSPVTAYNDRNFTLFSAVRIWLDGVPWNETLDLKFISLLPTVNDSGLHQFSGTPIKIEVGRSQ